MGWYVILLAACVPLVLVPLMFIYNCVYQDGIVGRLGLVCISMSSAFVLMFHLFAESDQGVPLALFAMQSGAFAVFMVWHLFRFHSRVLREKSGKERGRICVGSP